MRIARDEGDHGSTELTLVKVLASQLSKELGTRELWRVHTGEESQRAWYSASRSS